MLNRFPAAQSWLKGRVWENFRAIQLKLDTEHCFLAFWKWEVPDFTSDFAHLRMRVHLSGTSALSALQQGSVFEHNLREYGGSWATEMGVRTCWMSIVFGCDAMFRSLNTSPRLQFHNSGAYSCERTCPWAHQVPEPPSPASPGPTHTDLPLHQEEAAWEEDTKNHDPCFHFLLTPSSRHSMAGQGPQTPFPFFNTGFFLCLH